VKILFLLTAKQKRAFPEAHGYIIDINEDIIFLVLSEFPDPG
jgi:hypothetical protein